MKKKTVIHIKLIGILSVMNFVITGVVCFVGGWRTLVQYSNALFLSATLAFVLTFILYLSSFAKRGSQVLKHYSKAGQDTEQLKKEENINLSVIVTAIAIISLIGSLITGLM